MAGSESLSGVPVSTASHYVFSDTREPLHRLFIVLTQRQICKYYSDDMYPDSVFATTGPSLFGMRKHAVLAENAGRWSGRALRALSRNVKVTSRYPKITLQVKIDLIL